MPSLGKYIRFDRSILLALLFALALPGLGAAQEEADAADDAAAAQVAADDDAEASTATAVADAGSSIDREAIRADRTVKAYKYPPAPRISRYLGAAAKASDEGDPKKAQELLDKLNPKRLNPYERALVYRLKSFIAYSSGDYAGAIENFELVLAEEVMPIDAEDKIRFNIAQIYASTQKWQKAIDALDRWFLYAEEPLPLAYYLRGIAYYQLDDMDAALTNTKQAIDLSPEPAEGWLQLLAALYIQNEDYANATPLFENLLMRYPKKQYWVQLSLIYGARDKFSRSLAVQQVAYLQGFLTEHNELLRLTRSCLYHDLPLQAAQVLEKGLADGTIKAEAESYELLANSLIAAREYDRSLDPLHKAAEVASDGNLFLRLGQVYLQREEWNLAAAEFQRAIDKGGLKEPGNAQLLMGIALYNDNRVGPAHSSFVRASQHESTRKAATQWIEHIATESKSG